MLSSGRARTVKLALAGPPYVSTSEPYPLPEQPPMLHPNCGSNTCTQGWSCCMQHACYCPGSAMDWALAPVPNTQPQWLS